MQANLREVAFPPPHSCQQGTPGNPTSRRGRKTWRKTNHSLLLPSRQNKKEKRTWKRSCTAFAALAEISLQPVDSSASEEFALGCSSLPPDQNYPLFSLFLSPFGNSNNTQNRVVSIASSPLTAAHRHGTKHHSSL